VEDQKYLDFYKQLTLDTDEPLTRLHLSIDAPVQMYALLYVPVSVERNIFSPRKQDGLSLYARKVLIQEYNTDLLPEYLRFVVGVVDSEDIPLNVSREAVQSSRIMSQLKRLLTSKTLDHLNSLASDQPEKYAKFWSTFGRFVKEGLALDRENTQSFLPLLRYHTLQKPDEWVSLSDYVQAMKDDQKKIYYILGDDERSVINSPHLEVFKRGGYDVLLMTDPADPFGLLHFTQYADYDLANAASDQPDLLQPSGSESESGDDLSQEARDDLIERFKQQLGDRVTGVQTTTRLVESPARLVDAEGALNAEMQRVYRMMNREYEAPQKQIEINPQHPILKRLSSLPLEDARNALIIEQVYEDALLIEGLHPDPASMIARIQKIMEAALGNEE
jgi:molecular chaperone HtpG